MPALASDPAHPARGSWPTVVADAGPGDRPAQEHGGRALLPIGLLRSGASLGILPASARRRDDAEPSGYPWGVGPASHGDGESRGKLRFGRISSPRRHTALQCCLPCHCKGVGAAACAGTMTGLAGARTRRLWSRWAPDVARMVPLAALLSLSATCWVGSLQVTWEGCQAWLRKETSSRYCAGLFFAAGRRQVARLHVGDGAGGSRRPGQHACAFSTLCCADPGGAGQG